MEQQTEKSKEAIKNLKSIPRKKHRGLGQHARMRITDVIKEDGALTPPDVPRRLPGLGLPRPLRVLHRADLRGEDRLPDLGPGQPSIAPAPGVILA